MMQYYDLSSIVSYFLLTDLADFNSSAFEVVFPPDENGALIADIDAFIPIVDDDINEAASQYFVVHIELLSAVNPALIQVPRATSNCIILDNDGKLGEG